MTKTPLEQFNSSMFLRTYRVLGPLVERLCEHEIHLMRAVAFGGDETVHFIAAVLSRRREQIDGDPAGWANRLAHSKRITLLAECFGPAPTGYVAALGRCGPSVLPLRQYETLYRALADKNRAPLLLRTKRIRAPLLAMLNATESECFGNSLLAELRCGSMDQVGLFLDRLRARLAQIREATPSAVLPRFDSCMQLEAYLETRNELVFPNPPWVGDSVLCPVRDVAELRHLANCMENCLDSYVESALCGDCAFYRTVNGPTTVAQLGRDVGGTWAVMSVEGLGDESEDRSERVRDHLESLGFLPRRGLGEMREIRRVIGSVFGPYDTDADEIALNF